jgi:uncharacterized protein (TIGR03437 family)
MVTKKLELAAEFRSAFVAIALVVSVVPTTHAQQNILGANLIVNGGADVGMAGTGASNIVSSIPGWSRATGNVNVLPYGLPGLLLSTQPGPPDRSFQYFVASPAANSSTLSQTIDVSSGSSLFNSGSVKFMASAYLGTLTDSIFSGSATSSPAQLAIAFQNSNGQTFTTVTLGPLSYPNFPNPASGMWLQQQIGLVPSGTAKIIITLTLNSANSVLAVADSLSLVLVALGPSPSSVLGTNLVVNGNAESGPGVAFPGAAPYVPGWSTTNYSASVAPYGGTNWISSASSGPADRGTNLFCTGPLESSDIYQDIDVSAASSLIDAGQVSYDLSVWLGFVGLEATKSTLTYAFFDWTGNQLAATGQLVPAAQVSGALFELANEGPLPAGTRRVRISLSFQADSFATALADDIAFTLAAPTGPPVVTPGGIVSASAFGGFSAISPGSWIEIYGQDLASSAGGWSGSNFVNGVAPTTLGGVSISIGGQAAFIDYVSPGQINALVPSTTSTGVAPVTVTNGNGTSDKFWLIVNPTEPGLLAPSTFMVGGKQYVAALLSDGLSYALPQGAVTGVSSRPAHAGETVTIFGVGFGPVTGGLAAGTIVTQQNSLTTPFQLLFGTTSATVDYDGLVPSYTGLYQFNVVVPSAGVNSTLPVSFTLGGTKSSQTLYIAVQN